MEWGGAKGSPPTKEGLITLGEEEDDELGYGGYSQEVQGEAF